MHPGFVNAAEMLPVPRTSRLAAKKVGGKVCVWCGITPDSPVKLGPRIRPGERGLVQFFPVGCHPCATKQASRVHQLHLRTCARCIHRDYCPDSRALHNLATGNT